MATGRTLPNPEPSFWRDKRVLLTGHTGFKGSWLALWLERLGARVTGIALPPCTEPSLFRLAKIGDRIKGHEQDIRNAAATAAIVRATEPEIVFHLAAQPLVRASYRDPLGTFATNIQGTANVLDSLRELDTGRVAIAITSDKVYRNLEHPFPYRETDVLGGHDPYSASKAAAELVVASYRDAFLAERGVPVATARAGNVIGGGDWSEDRLIPDAVRAWSAARPLQVRRPSAIRPWHHVLESVGAYLQLAERLWANPGLAGAYNFGPETHEAATVRDVVDLACAAFQQGDVHCSDVSDGPHEAGWLALEVAKARHALGVKPRWSLATSVERTMRWYLRQAAGEAAAALCAQDIAAYEASSARL
ncbi:MAG: CDP-glucose 4,6-dehydratase [Thiohalocapsa sp.]